MGISAFGGTLRAMSTTALSTAEAMAAAPSSRAHAAAPRARTAQRWALLAFVLVMATAWLGTRPLWDPDEGRYTNVALNMLERGEWLIPVRNDDTEHWTKPPLTYWALASSFAVFGANTWAARLPNALAFLALCAAIGRVARRLGLQRPEQAVLAYASMLMPAVAVQLITTDFLLATCTTWAAAAWLSCDDERDGHDGRQLLWAATAGCFLALGFLTKGPPALLIAAGLLAGDVAGGVRRRALTWLVTACAFLVVATPWFAWVAWHVPGLLDHLVGAEVHDRLLTDRFARHAQWYGWLWIYLPTLLLGALPWTISWWRGLRGVCGSAFRRSGSRAAEAADAMPATAAAGSAPASHAVASTGLHGGRRVARVLVLWFGVPLLVFCLARSRLPLYVLPLFSPMALMVAWQWQRERRDALPWRGALAVACLILLLRAAAPWMPSERDAAVWSHAIRERVGGTPDEVVFVEDKPRFGLHLHLYYIPNRFHN